MQTLRALLAAPLDPSKREAAAFPWWFIFDPALIAGKCMSFKLAGSNGVSCVTGPFFSRESAEEAMRARHYEYSIHAFVYCPTGHRSPDYRALLELAKAETAEWPAVDSEPCPCCRVVTKAWHHKRVHAPGCVLSTADAPIEELPPPLAYRVEAVKADGTVIPPDPSKPPVEPLPQAELDAAIAANQQRPCECVGGCAESIPQGYSKPHGLPPGVYCRISGPKAEDPMAGVPTACFKVAMPIAQFREEVAAGKWPNLTPEWLEMLLKEVPATHMTLDHGSRQPIVLRRYPIQSGPVAMTTGAFGPEEPYAEPFTPRDERTFIAFFKGIQALVHENARAKGWWDEERPESERIALMHSELSEALEGLRHGNPPSDHIPEFTAAEEEYADVIIRIMDNAAAKGHRVAEAVIAKMAFNTTREHRHGGKAF